VRHETPVEVGILSLGGDPDDCSERQQLLKLSKHSARYAVVEPPQAQVVLVTGVNAGSWHSALWSNSFIKRHARKCFAISESDSPKPLLHGIYTSATQGMPFRPRLRTAAYGLAPKHWHNPLQQTEEQLNKKFLYSFIGRDSSQVRKTLFGRVQHPEQTHIEDTSRSFDMFNPSTPKREAALQHYADVLACSLFAICPRGNGAASLRLFEAMQMGVAPVILSDDWILPEGPDWSRCALQIPESDVDSLPQILEARRESAPQIGEVAHKAFNRFFAPEVYFDYLVGQALSIQQTQTVPEKLFFAGARPLATWWCLRQEGLRSAARLFFRR